MTDSEVTKNDLFEEWEVSKWFDLISAEDGEGAINRMLGQIENSKIPVEKTELVSFLKGETDKKSINSIKIREAYTIVHTLIDMFLFFSDVFLDGEKNIQHQTRVNKFRRLLKHREDISENYIKKLMTWKEGYESKNRTNVKIKILLPLFPQVAITTFPILNELQWLIKLMSAYDAELWILFLDKPVKKMMVDATEDEHKRKYFEPFAESNEELVKEKKENILKLDKLRLETFVKNYIRNNATKNKYKEDKILEIIKRVKVLDIKDVEDIEDVSRKEQIQKQIHDIGDVYKSKKDMIKRSLTVSDISKDEGVPKLFEVTENELCENSSVINVLRAIDKLLNDEEEVALICVQTFRAMTLYNFYLDKLIDKNKYLFGWDLHIPTTIPPIFLQLRYLATLSKSYNYPLMKKTFENELTGDERCSSCYFAIYLEKILGNILNSLNIIVEGPECDKCSAKAKTVLIRNKCSKYCSGEEHWVFKCPMCSHIMKNPSDYAWIPIEIFYKAERDFLEIPYNFLLMDRKWKDVGKPKITIGASDSNNLLRSLRENNNISEQKKILDEILNSIPKLK